MNIGQKIFNNLKKKYYNPDRPTRFNILFCPYKESMWDSMLTIWEAAVNDYETHTDVMPIPYFSLTKGVPCKSNIEFADYTYNFPEALNDCEWDVILFHYPYDRNNNVTRPMLLSTDLKPFCKHLVLIGYSCIGDRDLLDYEICLPGVFNSDLVIQETEKQAEQATRVLRLKVPESHTEFVGWGSAKYDCLERSYSIPSEWFEKVEYRKVILLQTSITPYLNNKDKLTQIEQIINKYSRNNSVCLMYRPHPLLEDTIKAHNPSDLPKWNEIIRKLETSDKDILDRTDNLHRAIYMSDELISDKSSVVILYQKTGKKITILEK